MVYKVLIHFKPILWWVMFYKALHFLMYTSLEYKYKMASYLRDIQG
jgi:hypothetical protein